MNFTIDDKLKLKAYGMFYGLLFLILGVLFLAIPYDVLMTMIFVFMGLFIVIVSVFPCIYSYMLIEQDRLYIIDAVVYTISILVGCLLMFQHDLWLVILFAVWILAASIIRLSKQKFSFAQIRKEIPMIFLGSLFLFYPMGSAFEIVLKIFGGILLVLGVVLLIFANIPPKDSNNTKSNGPKNNFFNQNEDNSDNKDRVVINAKYKDIN